MKPIIFLTIIFSSFLGLYSQNETGIRSGNLGNMNYFDIHNNIYPLQVPVLKIIPPIDDAMPKQVKKSYRMVDVLARKYTTSKAISYIESLHCESKEFATILKHLFILENYDFVRFTQYIFETNYNQLGLYKADLEDIRRFILSKFIQDNLPSMKKNLAILGSQAILKIQVVRIDSMKAIHASASRNADTLTYDFYKATFRILDTLKGNILPCSEPYENLKSEQGLSFSFPTMFFRYDENTFYQDRWESHRIPLFKKIEPMLYDSSNKMCRFKQEDTAIVFIDNSYLQSDKFNDFMYLRLSCYYSNAALPVVNGMVKDINHIWFDQDFTPYQDWKNHFNSIKDSILRLGE